MFAACDVRNVAGQGCQLPGSRRKREEIHMPRNYKRLVAAAAGLAAAASIVLTGFTAASASPRTTSAATGTERFQLVTASATATTGLVIAHGLFTSHAVDHMGSSVDKFVFAHGTFKVRHSPGSGPQSFNTRTCLLTANIHGTYKIFGGTGVYAGIKGHGTYQVTILAIGGRSKGKCSMSKEPVAFEQTIQAHGPVTR